MSSILETIYTIPRENWNYYSEIAQTHSLEVPFFSRPNLQHNFIQNYFKQAGKADIFQMSHIDPNTIFRPHHINSVFFLGILLYYKTDLHKKYKIGTNDPSYNSFPFIWFLVALFHDNAYTFEKDDLKKEELKHIQTIDDLKIHFDVKHFLFDTKLRAKVKELLDSRIAYFNYRRNTEKKVIDHGLLGGILLYDRLYKIRKHKKEIVEEDSLFWGRKLIHQYKLAAHAISLHNIWLPTEKNKNIYIKCGLQDLIGIKKVKFKDFPLFYLLAVIDTIEPLKAFMVNEYEAADTLNNLDIKFTPDSVTISKVTDSDLHFSTLTDKLKGFDNWLDIEYTITENSFTINFR